jgi:hypothetical protein
MQEALRELGRVVVLSIIPVLIDSLNKGEIDYRTVLVVGAIAGLRFIDKFLHEQAPEGKAGGLTNF